MSVHVADPKRVLTLALLVVVLAAVLWLLFTLGDTAVVPVGRS